MKHTKSLSTTCRDRLGLSNGEMSAVRTVRPVGRRQR
jgi:hypothetical protein